MTINVFHTISALKSTILGRKSPVESRGLPSPRGGSHVDQDTIYKYLKTCSTLTNSSKTVILWGTEVPSGVQEQRWSEEAEAKCEISVQFLTFYRAENLFNINE